MEITNYNYSSNNQVTDILRDGFYLWIAYQGSSGSTILKKVSAFNPYQTYYTLTVTVDNINDMIVDNNYIYCAVDSDDYIGVRYSTNNPLNDYDYFDKPTGITENAVALTIDSNDKVYFLLPGTASGVSSAKILKYDDSGTYEETISLLKSGEIIMNATSITVDSSDNLWVVDYNTPAKLTKVWDSGGWDFQSWNIF